jgi:transcriptional regulator with XRE-family HTH domain
MKDQLIRIMESEGMSPAKFADEIGVQRSSISHILSERNKPSYDFILKVLSKFPGISAEWLLTGSGTMIKSVSLPPKDIKQPSLFDLNSNQSQNLGSNNIATKGKIYADISTTINSEKASQQNNSNEKLSEKIVKNTMFTNVNEIQFVIIYYKDGTFERYTSR